MTHETFAATDTIEMLCGWAAGAIERVNTTLDRLIEVRDQGFTAHATEIEHYAVASARAHVAGVVMSIRDTWIESTNEEILAKIHEAAVDQISDFLGSTNNDLISTHANVHINAAWRDVYRISVGKL